MNFSDIKLGQTIRIYYTGGSHGAGYRLVRVLDIENELIRGTDVTYGGVKSFRRDRIAVYGQPMQLVADSDEQVIDPKTFLSETALVNVKTEAIAVAYKALYGRDARWVPSVNMLAVKVDTSAKIKVTLGKPYSNFVVTNTHGEALGFKFNTPNLSERVLGVYGVPVEIVADATADEMAKFAKQLLTHLGIKA